MDLLEPTKKKTTKDLIVEIKKLGIKFDFSQKQKTKKQICEWSLDKNMSFPHN